MEVTSLCITQLISVLVLLSAQVQHSCSHKAAATFPRIVPSRLQLFEYETVFINCEGFFNDLIKWRVMRKIKGITTICNNRWETTGPCRIKTAYQADSGEYWCESGGKKSNTVNITVTAGSVVLESPVRPVMEGEDVTLRCRNKTTFSGTADFYKDGRLVNTSSVGELIIHGVSKSDEGLYKCSISGGGQSAESWLAVRAVILESPALPVTEGEAVSLRCRHSASSNFTADFYKDGLLIRSSSTGNMTIHSVSKSDEGLYKCNISGHGESAESWLAVRVPAYREETPYQHSPRVFFMLCLIVTVLLVSLLLLSVLGLQYLKIKGVSSSPPSFSASSPPLQTVSAEASVDDPNPAIYAVVKKHGKEKETSVDEHAAYSVSMIENGAGVPSCAATPAPSESTDPPSTEEHWYYTID